MRKRKDGGFTLIELTIAIAIFGFMLLAMTQVIRQEVNLYNQVKQQEILDQKVRTAMQVILDQFGLKSYKYYLNGSVYYTDPSNNTVCLLNCNPVDPLLGTTILYYRNNCLYYYDHLVADDISLNLTPGLSGDSQGNYHFVLITVKTTNQSFQLKCMARLN